MKIKFATRLNETTQQKEKFYPVSIAAAIADPDRNQRLNVTLADIYSRIPSQAYATIAECRAAASELT